MKILVTGGAGYIGGYLCDILSSNGYAVSVYDSLIYEDRFLKKIDFIRGDIRDKERLSNIINNYDAVIWLAAIVGDGACAIDPALSKSINTDTVEWLSDNYDGKIIFTSTCHDTSTKLMTKRGFLDYDQICYDDEALTLNLKNNAVEWKRINRIIIKEFDGEMICLNGRRVSFLTTPEHRWLFNDKKFYYKNGSELLNTNTELHFPTGFKWNAKSETTFSFKDPYFYDNCPDSMPSSDLMYLTGIFVGDGYINKNVHDVPNKTGLSREDFVAKCRNSNGQFSSNTGCGTIKTSTCRSYGVHFCLPNGDPARADVLHIFENHGIKYWTNKDRIGISSRRLYDYFSQFGSVAKNKHIPRWVLDRSAIDLQRLFDGLIASDGNHSSVAKGKQPNLVTSSRDLAFNSIEIALKIGISASISEKDTQSSIKGRILKGHRFLVCFSHANKTYPSRKIKSQRYKGVVWCLDMQDNDNFFVMRNGKINVSGNCSVYGVNNALIDETTMPDPLSVYAATKLAAERHLIKKNNCLVFRLGTLYGIGDSHSRVRFDLVVNILAQKAAAGQPLTVFGGEQWRPLLHVSDVSHAILHGLQRNITGLYNLHNENRKIYEIADEITRLIPGTRVIYNDIKFEDARNYRVTSDAYRNTGWLPQKTLEDGILEMYNVIKEKRIKDIHSSIYSNVEYIKENHIPD